MLNTFSHTQQLAHNQLPGTTTSPIVGLVVSCLRKALTRYEASQFIKYLVAPSPISLARFFNCTLEEIEEALAILQTQGYDYDIHSHNAPLTLWDPTVRTGTRRHYPAAPLHLP